MSTRRSRTSKFTEEEMNDLVLRLKALLPQLTHKHSPGVSASKMLKETCSYIRKLRGELDDSSEKLSQILESMDSADLETECLGTLLEN